MAFKKGAKAVILITKLLNYKINNFSQFRTNLYTGNATLKGLKRFSSQTVTSSALVNGRKLDFDDRKCQKSSNMKFVRVFRLFLGVNSKAFWGSQVVEPTAETDYWFFCDLTFFLTRCGFLFRRAQRRDFPRTLSTFHGINTGIYDETRNYDFGLISTQIPRVFWHFCRGDGMFGMKTLRGMRLSRRLSKVR